MNYLTYLRCLQQLKHLRKLRNLRQLRNLRYFIFDTGVPSKNPGESDYDIEFVQYFWSKRQYNKVRVGDYFVYRKPTKVS